MEESTERVLQGCHCGERVVGVEDSGTMASNRKMSL